MPGPRFPQFAADLIDRFEHLMDWTIPGLERDWTDLRARAEAKKAEVGKAHALRQELLELLEHLGYAQRTEDGDWAITRPKD